MRVILTFMADPSGPSAISLQFLSRSPLVVIIGPTGAGKSELALYLARQFAGEIIGCDSLQIYRHFDIGTAKLPLGERQGIRHHLIDIIDPDRHFTAGEYVERACPILQEIAARGNLPVIVGGTGFYLRALLEGLSPGPARDEALLDRLRQRSLRRPASIHRILSRLDPESGARIHPNDKQKSVRALEVCLLARKPMSQVFRGNRAALSGFSVLKLGLNPSRTLLYERLDGRCREMFRTGLLDEVRSVLAAGVSKQAKPFESLGYKEALLALDGQITEEEALALTQRDTRRYAKRQLTWFRRESGVTWFDGFGDDSEIATASCEVARKFLEACYETT